MLIDRKWTDGYAVTKFRNVNRDGTLGYSTGGNLGVGIDFPLFRLAEQYLIYSEAVVRGGTGDPATKAVSYFNKIRERAFGNSGNDVASLTTDLILDERGRELYWEGFRRTDLIRNNKFVESAYLWPWKAGIAGGAGVDAIIISFPYQLLKLNCQYKYSSKHRILIRDLT